MRFGRLGQLKHAYNAMTTRASAMPMDIRYQEMDENEIVEFEDPLQETAFVITTGNVEICWNGKKELMHRESLLAEFREVAAKVWDEGNEICPTCGQHIQPEKVAQMRAAFNQEKSAHLEDLNKIGRAHV